jgi:hypothetical protein
MFLIFFELYFLQAMLICIEQEFTRQSFRRENKFLANMEQKIRLRDIAVAALPGSPFFRFVVSFFSFCIRLKFSFLPQLNCKLKDVLTIMNHFLWNDTWLHTRHQFQDSVKSRTKRMQTDVLLVVRITEFRFGSYAN